MVEGSTPTSPDTVAKVPGVDVATQLRFGTGCSLDSTKGKEVAASPTVGRDTDTSTCRAGDSAAPPGESVFLVGIDPATFFQLVDVGNVMPTKDALGDDEIAVQDTVLTTNHWKIGQKVRMWFSQVGNEEFRIASTYDKPFGGGGSDQYVVNLPTFDRVSNPAFQLTNSIYVKVAADKSVSAVQHEIEKVVKPVAPAAEVQDISTFVRDQTKQLEGFLNIIYVLLFLAIIVAVFGISITMSLSIYERTRELGLLRAIGMGRGQMRTSVRWEAAVISLFGTLLGLGTGVVLSIALVYGFSDQGIVLDLPWVTIVIIAIGGAIAGLLAARRPAKRAAGLDILDAIARGVTMMAAGYSGTPLPKKLGVAEGARLMLLGAPDGFDETLGALPNGVEVVRTARGGPTSSSPSSTDAVSSSPGSNGSSAPSSPTAASGSPGRRRRRACRPTWARTWCARSRSPRGLVDNKVCAIDDTWSGLRIVWRRENRSA